MGARRTFGRKTYLFYVLPKKFCKKIYNLKKGAPRGRNLKGSKNAATKGCRGAPKTKLQHSCK